jgi:hypothetical protein
VWPSAEARTSVSALPSRRSSRSPRATASTLPAGVTTPRVGNWSGCARLSTGCVWRVSTRRLSRPLRSPSAGRSARAAGVRSRGVSSWVANAADAAPSDAIGLCPTSESSRLAVRPELRGARSRAHALVLRRHRPSPIAYPSEMSKSRWSIVLAAALVVAGTFAFLRRPDTAPPKVASPADSQASRVPTSDREAPSLPPNHPPIGGEMPRGNLGSENRGSPALLWRAPSGWTPDPNPHAMRLATYRVPSAKGDSEPTEMTVSRAGGSTEANIRRWVGQFDEAGRDTLKEKTVAGMHVTTVEVGGTYLAGGMMGASPAARHPGFMLLGAVVETPSGPPYFFKLVGPTASVRAAQAGFNAMMDGLVPNDGASTL